MEVVASGSQETKPVRARARPSDSGISAVPRGHAGVMMQLLSEAFGHIDLPYTAPLLLLRCSEQTPDSDLASAFGVVEVACAPVCRPAWPGVCASSRARSGRQCRTPSRPRPRHRPPESWSGLHVADSRPPEDRVSRQVMRASIRRAGDVNTAMAPRNRSPIGAEERCIGTGHLVRQAVNLPASTSRGLTSPG